VITQKNNNSKGTYMRKKHIQKNKAEDQKSNIHIGSKHKGHSILVSEVLYLEACENYTFIYLQNGKRFIGSKPLKHYEDLLNEKDFVRIHRSFLVHLRHVKEYECKYRLLHLSGNRMLSVSHRKKYHISRIIHQNKLQIAADKVA
jgi:two-component system LytT family response regulator